MLQRSRRDSGQALVEFALSLIVLVLLIFAVIEGGRLLHGWITLQNAAREGGRYAITGDYDQSCLAATPACPDARVFSIKNRVIESTTGLAIDPQAGYDAPRYLRVEVSGVNKDNVWQTEYPGEPGKPVMVRATYHMPVVTPLLRPIAESIRLSGQVVVNNENFAQVSSGRRSLDLAKLPPPPPPTIPVADLQLKQDVTPLVALVNESIAYTLRISNNGPDEARGVRVVDELPQGVTILSTTPAGLCDQSGQVLTCELPNLPRGVNTTINLTVQAPAEPPPPPGDVVNRARVSGSEKDEDLSNNEDMARTVVVLSESVADLEVVSKDDLPDPVVINQKLTYTILVRNNGIADATGVELTDQLPEGMVYESASVSSGSGCRESGGTVFCDLGNIAVDETATASIVLWAPPSPGTRVNVASVAGDQVDPNERNNENLEPTTISPEWSDLYVSMSDQPDPVLAGNEITYAILAGNNGPSDADNVTVVDTLPAGVKVVSVTPSQGTCSDDEYTLTCDLETLPRSQEATIEVVVIPDQKGTVTNQATITSDQTDPNSVNDSDTAITTVEPMADLAITKSATPSTPPGVTAGNSLTYRLDVINEGPSPATNVKVQDPLPLDASFVDVSTTQGTCQFSGGTIDCNLGNLALGDDATITIQVIPELEGVLLNSATVTGDQPDTDQTDNLAEDTTTVHKATDAFITLDPVCGKPGSSMTIHGFNWPSEGNKDVLIYWNAAGRGSLIGTVADNGITWSITLNIPVNASQGSHTIFAERQGVLAEATYSVPCPAPNLTISQPEIVYPEPVSVGDAVTFQAEISNDGDLDAVNQFFVSLYFDPPLPQGSPATHIPQNYRTKLVAISWLAVGESRTVSITAKDGFGESGLHDVYMVVDSDPGPDGIVDEIDEHDNLSALLQVDVESSPVATATPGPTPRSTTEIYNPGSLIGQAFLSPVGGQPVPQAGVEVSVYDTDSGSLDGVAFTDGDGSYFMSNLKIGLKTVSACIIIDDTHFTYTATGVEISEGQITFKDLFLDEGICN